MIRNRILTIVVLLSVAAIEASAESATVQTPSPVIYLEDNAGEPDGLGWCLDTQGRGLSDRMHTHSCKPQGGDVQFYFNATDQIESYAFAGRCAELDAVGAGKGVGLAPCSNGKALQLFRYDPANMTIHPMMDASLCLVAGDAVNPAGPFSSKTLVSQECASAIVELKRWVLVD